MKDLSSDSVLLTRVAAHDRDALHTLYGRYAESITAFVKNWLSDPFEASDILHETMLEVWRSAEKFQGRSSPKTWIFSIARNKSIDRNRKASRSIVQEIDPNISDDAPDPQSIAERFQSADKVRACIEKLSALHKAVIHLAFYEDLTYPEIAEIEKRPLGTIKTRMMHAKKLLMRCLGQ
ncbi:RNA polymerase sigma factor [Kordiimonas aquimaris]|uniref:RNA polymerase sigma factor n=1 Tax=Kordiimonas aquimaris TaxID=707591 RepID=UPI0021D0E7DD|nr:sigma-70 family RNA polymerase sigma factor [Kordiimonas aquimaris]